MTHLHTFVIFSKRPHRSMVLIHEQMGRGYLDARVKAKRERPGMVILAVKWIFASDDSWIEDYESLKREYEHDQSKPR